MTNTEALKTVSFSPLGSLQSGRECNYTVRKNESFQCGYTININEIADNVKLSERNVNLLCTKEQAHNIMQFLYENRVSPTHVFDVLDDMYIKYMK